MIELIAPNEIAIQILSFDELWGNKPNSEGKLLFRVNCMPIEFAKAVHVAATAVLEENGEEGYRGKWNEHAFPMRLLALLGEEIALLTVSGLLTAFFP